MLRLPLLATCATAAALAHSAQSLAVEAPAFAVSNVFGDHAVLQRDRPVVVWGFGTPGSSVTATFPGGSGAPVCSNVGADTVWRCTVPATAAGGPYALTFASSTGESAGLADILFGDVYLIGGQSNAVFSVSQAFNASAEVAAATEEAYPTIRLFTVGSSTRMNKTQAQLVTILQPWTAVSPAAVGDNGGNFTYFSAVGWFFGRDLYERLDKAVPLGLISNNYGGTLLQEWTAPEDLLSSGCAQNPSANPWSSLWNSDLWDPMILPYTVGPMALKGVVWYQAESNIDTVAPGFCGAYYGCQFPATISSWRRYLQQPDLPWIFVQLAAYTAKSGNTSNILPDMRQGQLNATKALDNVWFVTAMDLGDWDNPPWTDIHPRLKQPVGRRLADVAAVQLYGMSGITAQGPQYGSSTIVSAAPGFAAVHVRFDPATMPGSTRVTISSIYGQACPASYNYTRYCSGFTISFSDGSAAEIDVSDVSVDADGRGIVMTAAVFPASVVPVATSYAYAPWPVTSLYTQDGWPVLGWSRPVGA